MNGLARAIETAASMLPGERERVDCIIACNTAHYFWGPLQNALGRSPDLLERLNLISMVECTVLALASRAYRRVLLLCTEGSRLGRVFSGPGAAAGLRLE